MNQDLEILETISLKYESINVQFPEFVFSNPGEILWWFELPKSDVNKLSMEARKKNTVHTSFWFQCCTIYTKSGPIPTEPLPSNHTKTRVYRIYIPFFRIDLSQVAPPIVFPQFPHPRRPKAFHLNLASSLGGRTFLAVKNAFEHNADFNS